jgi:hypothetical protein
MGENEVFYVVYHSYKHCKDGEFMAILHTFFGLLPVTVGSLNLNVKPAAQNE